jgi:hypothetical protein
LQRYNYSGWAIKAANGAIIKLLGIEKRDVLPNDNPIGILEEESKTNLSMRVTLFKMMLGATIRILWSQVML